MRVAIVDGYTDEPASLGVPPYIAPLPRYIAGAALEAGADEVAYHTIDQLRAAGAGGSGRRRGSRSGSPAPPPGGIDLLVLVGGALVPGRYLRGRPASSRELVQLASSSAAPTVLAGPVARYGWTSGAGMTRDAAGAFDNVAGLDGDAYVHDLIRGQDRPADRYRTPEEWDRWSVSGAKVVQRHPDHPRPLIAEMETYRGCVRHMTGGCSFCTTVRDHPPLFRSPEAVAAEAGALARAGVVALRLGGQSCIYSYMAHGVGATETPEPNVEALRRLLEGIRSAAPDLEVLHVDNANPAVIAAHPEEASEATRVLAAMCTGGNVVALGLESADPAVREANNLNSTPEQCMEAIRTVNEHGGAPTGTGLPALLPGVNFLGGLRGETEATFGKNMAFLKGVLDEGLLLRRINIRQVSPICGSFETRRHHSAFLAFKREVRERVDRPLLRALLPFGSRLTGVFLEAHDGNTTFGRQVGSYPLTVAIPARLELGRFIDVRVVDQAQRSVTAVPDPLDVNGCPMSLLAAIPGVGRKRAARIARARPIRGPEDLFEALDDDAVARTVASLL